ncbi:PD-(D/E)XK nuclease family transposase [PVC group bacterium]|nr:PD-(D/E)XK nuclease family transposase [PVC group bacterium]
MYKLDGIPGKLQEKVFERFFEIAEIAHMAPEERSSYENSLKYYRDMNNVVATAKGEGWDSGKAEGLAEGKKEQAVVIAKACLKQKMDTENIAQITRLTIQEIEALKP